MRGRQSHQGATFIHVSLEKRVPVKHSLRAIRAAVNEVLAGMDAAVAGLYASRLPTIMCGTARSRRRSALGELAAQGVDQLHLLPDQRLAQPMDHECALMLPVPDRHATHAGALDGLADRLGIHLIASWRWT